MAIFGNVPRFYQKVKDSGGEKPQRANLKFTGSPVTVTDTAPDTIVDITPAADVDYYQTIQDAGSDQTQRSKLDFVGFTVADDSGGDRTIITAPTDTDYYQTIEDNGSGQTQRSKINFIGATVADNSGNDSTDITITGGGSETPIVVDAAASDTLLTTSEQVIITTTQTPVAGNKYVKLTYGSCYFNSGTLTGRGLVRIYKNVAGGGDVLIVEFDIERFNIYGWKQWCITIAAMANSSTVFEVRELLSASGGSLYNASGSGNTNTPAKLIIEQFS